MISEQFADIYARVGGCDINLRKSLIQQSSDQL